MPDYRSEKTDNPEATDEHSQAGDNSSTSAASQMRSPHATPNC
jgi:hypothetical protein